MISTIMIVELRYPFILREWTPVPLFKSDLFVLSAVSALNIIIGYWLDGPLEKRIVNRSGSLMVGLQVIESKD